MLKVLKQSIILVFEGGGSFTMEWKIFLLCVEIKSIRKSNLRINTWKAENHIA